MAKITEKLVNDTISSAISSSKNHEALLLKASAMALFWAAEHARCEPITRLYNEVSRADADSVRLFIVNATEMYGETVTADNGKERAVPFIRYNKDEKAWFIDNKSEPAKQTRKNIAALGIDGLEEKVPLGQKNDDRANRAENAFNWESRVLSLVKAGIANGAPRSEIETINSLLPNDKRMNVGKAIQKAATDAATAIKNANAKLARMGAVSSTVENTSEEPAEVESIEVPAQAAA